VSGEIWDYGASFLAKKGYKVLRLDFSNPLKSQSFNPLAACKTIADIQKVFLIIVKNGKTDNKADPFWQDSAILLCTLMGRYVVFHQEQEYRTIQNILLLVERFAYDSAAVDRLFIQTRDKELISSYKALVVSGEKTLQSIVATARASLAPWNDPEVCKTTATTTIDFSLLRSSIPVALFICNPLKDLDLYKPISTLFFRICSILFLLESPKEESDQYFF
jgi:type IV secretory pathway TraG/TraD family ATPase VirD4